VAYLVLVHMTHMGQMSRVDWSHRHVQSPVVPKCACFLDAPVSQRLLLTTIQASKRAQGRLSVVVQIAEMTAFALPCS
jgi:hypothetical protein